MAVVALLAQGVASQQLETQPQQDSIRYKYSRIDSAVVNIVWCGSDTVIAEDFSKVQIEGDSATQSILVLSNMGQVYRSTNRGFDFQNLTQLFQQSSKSKSSRVIEQPPPKCRHPEIVFFSGAAPSAESDSHSDTVISLILYTISHEFSIFLKTKAIPLLSRCY